MDLVLARQRAKQAPQVRYAERVQRFAADRLADGAAARDRAARFDAPTLTMLREAGLLSIELGPHDEHASTRPCGLADGSFSDVITAIRVLARTEAAAAVLVHVQNAIVVRLVKQYAAPAQAERWLGALATGAIGAFAATETQAGSDLHRMSTVAEPRTGGGYRLDGTKHWITNAAEADVFVTLTHVAGGGLAAFLVSATAPGVTVGPRIDKMSVRASSTCPLVFRNVDLDADALLGGPDMGFDLAMYGLVCGRIGIAAQMLGLAEGALADAVRYAREREAFGRPVFEHQGVSFPLAQISAEIAAVELMVTEAARHIDAGTPHLKVSALANKAKLLASQLAERATGASVETFGGNGVAESFPAERRFRDAKVGKIYEGTTNLLLRSIAQDLAG